MPSGGWKGLGRIRRFLLTIFVGTFKVALKTNPGSHSMLDYDQSTMCFKRLFVLSNASICGFNHLHFLLFLDETFLKDRYKGNLLAATGKDGNQGKL